MTNEIRKVVYNTDFGGFILSEAAINWLETNAREELRNFIKEKNKEYDAEPDEYLKTWERVEFAIRHDFNTKGIDRHDKDLIACVEALGCEKASGPYASLAIKELHGRAYRIDEYNGSENVIEPDEEEYIFIYD